MKIKDFIDSHQMVTIDEKGNRAIGTDGEALIWMCKHARTEAGMKAVMCGWQIAMIDGTKVVFERKEVEI